MRLCVVLLIISATKSFGCSCLPPRPPCEAFAMSPLIFLGTVTEVNSQTRKSRMNIDHVFKGHLRQSEELFDDGMCDGPQLEVGKQYLMYTTRFPGGAIAVRGCTRSRPVDDAEEDLEFLKQYTSGTVT